MRLCDLGWSLFATFSPDSWSSVFVMLGLTVHLKRNCRNQMIRFYLTMCFNNKSKHCCSVHSLNHQRDWWKPVTCIMTPEFRTGTGHDCCWHKIRLSHTLLGRSPINVCEGSRIWEKCRNHGYRTNLGICDEKRKYRNRKSYTVFLRLQFPSSEWPTHEDQWCGLRFRMQCSRTCNSMSRNAQ